MDIIIVLIFISVSIAVGFLILFVWSIRSGQYEDTYTPSVRMLFDHKPRIKERQLSTGELSNKERVDAPVNIT